MVVVMVMVRAMSVEEHKLITISSFVESLEQWRYVGQC